MNANSLRPLVATALLALTLNANAEPPKAGYKPDPTAEPSRTQAVFDVSVKNGVPTIESARFLEVEKPAATARVFGRYAIELYRGAELLDRIRFNVPLAGDVSSEPKPIRITRRPSFENVTTRLKVQMTDNPRANALVLVDRLTGETTKFDWPPGKDGKLSKKAPPKGEPAPPVPR